MADPIYITTQSNYTGGGDFSSFYFDAVHSFTPTFSSRMTKYTISDKSDITNHMVKENIAISMSATVTATPVIKYDGNLVGYTDFNERPKEALNLLYSWWNSNTDLFIDEGNRQYSRMNITNIQPREEGFDSITFDISFEQARRVGYQRVTLIADASTSKSLDGSPTTSKKTETSEERTSQLFLLGQDVAQQAQDLGVELPDNLADFFETTGVKE